MASRADEGGGRVMNADHIKQMQQLAVSQAGGATISSLDFSTKDLAALHKGPKGNLEKLSSYGGVEGVAKRLKVDIYRGISAEEVARRQGVFGRNIMPEKSPRWFIHHVWCELQDKTLLLFIFCAIAQVWQDQDWLWLESAAILSLVGVTLLLRAAQAWFQEVIVRSHHAETSKTQFTVLRDGAHVRLLTHDLVVGDVIALQIGDKLEADGLLVPGCSGVLVDQSSRSVDTSHDVKKDARDAPFLFSGTNIRSGSGLYLVTAVGINSTSGKMKARAMGIAVESEDDDNGEDEIHHDFGSSILKKKLDALVAIFGVFAFGSAGVASLVRIGRLVIQKYFFEGREFVGNDFNEIIQAVIIGTMVVLVALPKRLPLAASLSSSLSIIKLRHHGTLVCNVSAAETMGHVTTLCIDKTGVLTQSKMQVMRAYLGNTDFIAKPPELLTPQEAGSTKLLRSAIAKDQIDVELQRMIYQNINTNKDALAKVAKDSAGLTWEHEGNKIDCALLQFLKENNISKRGGAPQEIKNYPFTSSRKRSAKAVLLPSGECRLYVKGASEIIIRLCDRQRRLDGSEIKLNRQEEEGIITDVGKLGCWSLTTIALAYRDFACPPDWDEIVDGRTALSLTGLDATLFRAETRLTLLGVIGIHAPLRPNYERAIPALRTAGIDVCMVTGDDEATAIAIAQDAGIMREGIDYDQQKGPTHPHVALTGEEFRLKVLRKGVINQAAFDEIWPALRLLVRASPEDKRILVQGLKQSKLFKTSAGRRLNVYPDSQVVAFMGHGANSAPALKEADVGLAMASGTHVAKDAAGIIHLDESLTNVLDVCKRSRNVHDCLAKLVQFQLVANIVAVTITVLGALIAEGSTPLSVVQILWVSLIMDWLGAFSFAHEHPEEDVLEHVPHGKKRGLISYEMMCNLLCQCAYQLIVLMVVLFLGAGSWCSQEDPPECWEKGGIFSIANGMGQGRGAPATQHFTMIFNAFVCMQLFNWINCRKLHHECCIFGGMHRNATFIVIWVLCAAIQVLIVQIPAVVGDLSKVFRTTALDLHQWIFCVGCGVGSVILQLVIAFVGRELKPRLTRADPYKPGVRLDALPIPENLQTASAPVEDMPLKLHVHDDTRRLREEEQPLLQEDNPVMEGSLPEASLKVQVRSGQIVQETMGKYHLRTSSHSCEGVYIFDETSHQLQDSELQQLIGTLVYEPISAIQLVSLLRPGPGTAEIPRVRVEDSEIMTQIQMPANAGAYFVLPSQLNGAEYPSHDVAVDTIEKYKADDTGGPRGQLAVHPAVGQFLLDNAASDWRPQGINVLDGILQALWSAGFDFRCKNGYLLVPRLQDRGAEERALEVIRQHIHKLSILAMEGVPACGLTPDKSSLSKAIHAVNLVYSSAVPVQAYLNAGVDSAQEAFQRRVAETLLVAQYYSALRLAARPRPSPRRELTKVFLMPVGGGVFNNSYESIVGSIARAIEMLEMQELDKLDIRVLTWSSNPREREVITELLQRHRKFKAESPPPEPSAMRELRAANDNAVQADPQRAAANPANPGPANASSVVATSRIPPQSTVPVAGSTQAQDPAPATNPAPRIATSSPVAAPAGGVPASAPSQTSAPSPATPSRVVETPPLADRYRAASTESTPESLGGVGNYLVADRARRRSPAPLQEACVATYLLQWSFEDSGSLGLEIKWGDGYGLPIVGKLKSDNQAAKRGVLPGDKLLEINSIPTIGQQKTDLLPLLTARPLLLQVEREQRESNIRFAYMELVISTDSRGRKACSNQGVDRHGMEIDDFGSSSVVVWVLPGTPAYSAGVMAGDALVKINGQPVKGMPKQQTRRMLEEESLVLTLHRRPVSSSPISEDSAPAPRRAPTTAARTAPPSNVRRTDRL